jgi:ornithine cyclodeaminase
MSATVLTEEEVMRVLGMDETVERIEEAFREYHEGTLVSQPRTSFDTDSGSLVFSPGETSADGVIGTRVSGKFAAGGADAVDHDVATPVKRDVVVVFESVGEIKGVVFGSRTPDMRTGALGGVAIDHMAREDVSTLGIIGTGRQARTQLEAALAVREFDDIRVYSRTPENRTEYAADMHDRLGVDVETVDDPQEVVEPADVLACATSSPEPVFETEWLSDGTHVNTIGPPWDDAHELPMGVVERSDVIVTDALEQVEEYGDRYFLAGTEHESRMVELADIVVGEQTGRQNDDGITLFSPLGLPGSEVVVANLALEMADG